MAYCPAFDPLGPYVTGVVGFVDCRAVTLGEEGYRALGGGSASGGVLAGVLTIYVAVLGYRLMLGERLGVREGVTIMLRLGIVLALATQWSAYRALAYDVVISGPGEITAQIAAPSGLGGDGTGDLVARVETTYEALESVSHPVLDTASTDPDAVATQAGTVAATAAPPRPINVLPADSRAIVIYAEGVLVVASLAGFLTVRVVAGLLLAVGPLFIACFLFAATRGMFAGWVRALAGAALAAIAVPVVLALQLGVIEPQALALQAAVAAGDTTTTLPVELLATSVLFALVTLGALLGSAYAASGFRLPDALRIDIGQGMDQPRTAQRPPPVAAERPATDDREPGRARAVADAVRMMERREERGGEGTADAPEIRAVRIGESAQRSGGDGAMVTVRPLGQSQSRVARRQSASAGRRDARA